MHAAVQVHIRKQCMCSLMPSAAIVYYVSVLHTIPLMHPLQAGGPPLLSGHDAERAYGLLLELLLLEYSRPLHRQLLAGVKRLSDEQAAVFGDVAAARISAAMRVEEAAAAAVAGLNEDEELPMPTKARAAKSNP